MSIWSSIKLDSDELWTVAYGPPREDRSEGLGASVVAKADLDLATAHAHYGPDGLRLCLEVTQRAADGTDRHDDAWVVLPRQTAAALRDALTAWLDSTADGP